jgi:hypothetical protein
MSLDQSAKPEAMPERRPRRKHPHDFDVLTGPTNSPEEKTAAGS